MNLTPVTFENQGPAKGAAIVGAMLCVAGLMSYPLRAAIFLLWPDGPVFLLRTAPRTIALLVYPGLHLAEWFSGSFSDGGNLGYFAYLVSGLFGLAFNFAMWAVLAYVALVSFSAKSER